MYFLKTTQETFLFIKHTCPSLVHSQPTIQCVSTYFSRW
jgi:hypothetical protein